MKVACSILFFLFITLGLSAQSECVIQGEFPEALNKEILLKGFDSGGTINLTSTKTDAEGKFKLVYSSSYIGAALLEIKEGKSVIVLLNNENFSIKWDDFENFRKVKFLNSKENEFFFRGLELYQSIEQKKAGLSYLIPLYAGDASNQLFLKKEMKLQEEAFELFLQKLPKDSYASYYIKLRKLISDMPLTATKYTERYTENQKDFDSLNFADPRMEHSGLYEDLFYGYVQLTENFEARDFDKMYKQLNNSVDILLGRLKGKPLLLQDLSRSLFNLFERRSLFKAAEHLALAMLDDTSCQIDEKHQALFEQYRKMATGKTASDIVFDQSVKGYSKLSDIKSKYKLVVFGASWCSKCTEELPKLKPFYEKWHNVDDLEILFVSLDTEKSAFTDFVKDFSWVSICDYKSWESLPVLDYCVFATPTMYLLDSNLTILSKPISADHVEAILHSRREVVNNQ